MIFYVGILIAYFMLTFLESNKNPRYKHVYNVTNSLLLFLSRLIIVGLGISLLFSGFFFFLIFFIPFFLFSFTQPSKKTSSFKYHRKQTYEDFFKNFHQEHWYQSGNFHRDAHHEHDHYGYGGAHQQQSHASTARQGMSIQEAAAILNVSVHATEKEVKVAYRQLIMKHHPDKGGDIDFAKKINIAKEVMMAYAKQPKRGYS